MAVWQASQMAATMRMASSSSMFLMARAETIGDMPSAHWMPWALKELIMLRSMKSTPSGALSTPYFFISSRMARVNLVTCCSAAPPTAPLIHE